MECSSFLVQSLPHFWPIALMQKKRRPYDGRQHGFTYFIDNAFNILVQLYRTELRIYAKSRQHFLFRY